MVRLTSISGALVLAIATISATAVAGETTERSMVAMEGSGGGMWTTPQLSDKGTEPTAPTGTQPGHTDASMKETTKPSDNPSSSLPQATEQPRSPPVSPSSPSPPSTAPTSSPPPPSPTKLESPTPISSAPVSAPTPDTTVIRSSEPPSETPKPSNSFIQPVPPPTSAEPPREPEPTSSFPSNSLPTPTDTPSATSTSKPSFASSTPTSSTPEPAPTSKPNPTTAQPTPTQIPSTPTWPSPATTTPSPLSTTLQPTPTSSSPNPTTLKPPPFPPTTTPEPIPTTPKPAPTTTKPSPWTPTPKPSPTAPEPVPTTRTPTPTPVPTTPEPAPTTTKPSPWTPTPKPIPTTPEPVPTTRTPTPTPVPTTPEPAPTTTKPSPWTPTPKPIPTTPEPVPTTRTPTPKPNPTTRTPAPKPGPTTTKPDPTTRTPSPKPTADEPEPGPVPSTTKPTPTTSKPISLPNPSVPDSDAPRPVPTTTKPTTTTRPPITKTPVSSTVQPTTPVPTGTKISARDVDNDDFSEDAETPKPTSKRVTTAIPNSRSTKTPAPSTSPTTTRAPKSGAPSMTPKPTTKTPSPLAQQIITGTVKPKEGSQGGALAQDLSTTPATTGIMVIEQTNKGSESARETSTEITFRNDTHEETYKKYDRSTFKKIEDPVDLTNETAGSNADASGAQPKSNVVIGGRNRAHVAPGADVAVSAFTQDAQDAMRFASYGFTIVSAVLLMLYHLLGLFGPDWLPVGRSTTKISSWLTPNTWELIAVFGFFQHLGSISMLELTKAPYFVLDFTDSFSWTNYHLYSMGGGVTRRLEYVILTGMVAYADRLGVEETSLLAYTTHFFLAAVGILLLCFFLAMWYYRKLAQKAMCDADDTHEPKREYALYLLGLATALWMLSVFPLTAISSYELHMELRYTIGGNIAIVLFNLIGVVIGGGVFFLWRVRSLRTDEAMTHRHVSTLGTLYADKKRGARFFFVVVVLFEMLSGMFVGAVQGTPDQLIALLVVHGAFIVVLGVIRPYHDRIANICVSLFMMLRIVNLFLATSFLTESDMETSKRGSISNIFIVINFVVILIICFRQLLVFVYVLRMWSSHEKDDDYSNVCDGDHDLSDLGEDGHHVELQSTRRCGAIASDLAPVSLPQHYAQPRHPALPTPCTGQAAFADSPVPNLAHRAELPPFRDNYN